MADARNVTRYAACIVCESGRLSELARVDQIAIERVHRERLFRGLFPPGTPPYILKDRAFPTQTYDARLVMCDECGTLARDPHLSVAGEHRQYADDTYHVDWLESSYREFAAAYGRRMPELIRSIGPNARVLEIGSFVGGFLAAARDHGWQARGIDVGDCVTRFARSKGLDARRGCLDEMRFFDRAFDAVFIWHCFDQLPEPWQDLREIHRILKENGHLVIRVPNGAFVRGMHRLLRALPFELLRERVRRVLAFAGLAGFPFQIGYTPDSLSGMLQDSGFESIRIRNSINTARALRAVHLVSELVHCASLGSIACGPWIEISCSKADFSKLARSPRREPLLARLRGFLPAEHEPACVAASVV
jgi:SAM-dependent methyltransferase